MDTVRLVPASADRLDDVERVFDSPGEARTCQCQWWTMRNVDFQRADRDERAGLLRAELTADPAPALVAYVDDTVAGWVRVGPRPGQVRLGRTKELVAHSREDWDDPDVWAVSCFVVRPEHRRQGLTALLLDAAVGHAEAHGARIVEAYPIDPTADTVPKDLTYRGLLPVFLDRGFDIVARPRPDRAVVSLTLAGRAP